MPFQFSIKTTKLYSRTRRVLTIRDSESGFRFEFICNKRIADKVHGYNHGSIPYAALCDELDQHCGSAQIHSPKGAIHE